MMNEQMSSVAAAILEGLEEALADAKGEAVPGLKKTTVCRIEPKKVQKIAQEFGIVS